MTIREVIENLYQVHEAKVECILRGHDEVKILGKHGSENYVQCLGCGERYYQQRSEENKEL
jgi:hypothetical protein